MSPGMMHPGMARPGGMAPPMAPAPPQLTEEQQKAMVEEKVRFVYSFTVNCVSWGMAWLLRSGACCWLRVMPLAPHHPGSLPSPQPYLRLAFTIKLVDTTIASETPACVAL